MSTKKEEITITELQTKVEKQFKLLNTMHYQNEKMINGNADNINKTIMLLNNYKRDLDQEMAKSSKLTRISLIGLGVVIVFTQLSKYII